jgi:ketosteroid isomerase-like protein
VSADPREVATTYFRSWQDKDFDTLRSLLADDVTFRGPFGTADGVEECMRGLQGMAPMITRIHVRKIWVEGLDVITWYDLHTTAAQPAPTANWSHLENGRITAIRATFDARPFER